VIETPVAEPCVIEPPVAEPCVIETPVTEPCVIETAVTEPCAIETAVDTAEEPVAPEQPAEEPSTPAAEQEVAAEIPVSMKMTRKELEQFAQDNGLEIQGKTKAAFFDNLCAAWADRTSSDQQTARFTVESLPISEKSTLKEMKQFAQEHAGVLGELSKKSVAKAVYFAELTARARETGLLG
jgi:hypothetical protein